jgi:hypothetical protein
MGVVDLEDGVADLEPTTAVLLDLEDGVVDLELAVEVLLDLEGGVADLELAVEVLLDLEDGVADPELAVGALLDLEEQNTPCLGMALSENSPVNGKNGIQKSEGREFPPALLSPLQDFVD